MSLLSAKANTLDGERPADVRQALRPQSALISIMHVNREVGTVRPLWEFAEIAHEYGALRWPYFLPPTTA